MVGDLASALAARDPVTAAHSARVTFLAERLAAWLGWDEERLAALGFGARLHDIGKITVSTTILRKRGPLDARELAEIQTHPTAGAKLIGPAGPFDPDVAIPNQDRHLPDQQVDDPVDFLEAHAVHRFLGRPLRHRPGIPVNLTVGSEVQFRVEQMSVDTLQR